MYLVSESYDPDNGDSINEGIWANEWSILSPSGETEVLYGREVDLSFPEPGNYSITYRAIDDEANFSTLQATVFVVPEPSTVCLLLASAASLFFRSRKRNSA